MDGRKSLPPVENRNYMPQTSSPWLSRCTDWATSVCRHLKASLKSNYKLHALNLDFPVWCDVICGSRQVCQTKHLRRHVLGNTVTVAKNLTTLLLILIDKQTGLGLDVRGLTPGNRRFFFLLFPRLDTAQSCASLSVSDVDGFPIMSRFLDSVSNILCHS
jgi:hypothetical protein